MVDTKRKLQEFIDTLVKERRKKGLTISCKQTEDTVNSKSNNPRCELKIGDVKFDQIQKDNNLDNGKCDTES